MNVTSTLFEAFLKCPTKCYLRSTGQAGAGNAYAEWVRAQNDAYQNKAAKRVIESVADTEGPVTSPAAKDLKTSAWRLAVDLHVAAGTMESRIHAVERLQPQGRCQPAQFIPIRFTFFNKLTKDDRLLVAFDGLALSEVLGRDVRLGKIIHGDNHASLRVKIPSLLPKARKISEKIAALLASDSPPDLILNRHCEECEFRDRCRQKALEKDDLSLLGGMSAKERQKFRSKGIFSVTQLSYTFRPRRRPKRQRDKREKYHHALKALAIREKKIHIIGSPEFKIEGTPVYLDVEGLPDRDFYYLIGLRIGDGEATVQHSLWANTVKEEGKIWREFLAILETVEKPVLIHYGSYETTFARSMRKRHGNAGAGIAATALDAMVNVLSFVFAQIYFPSHSNSLKDLAGCLGFTWPDTALYGPNSIRSRVMWERSHETAIRDALIAYNVADCEALQCLCNHLSVLPQDRSKLQAATIDLVNVDEMKPLSRFHLINKDGAALPAFKTINKAAYWDYQRTRVYVRTSKIIKKASRQRPWVRAKRLRNERTVRYPTPSYCSSCGGTDLLKRRATNLLMHDIRFMESGAKGWLTRKIIDNRFCRRCGCLVRPPGIGAFAVRKFGRHLRAYAMYQLIQLRVSGITVAESLSQLFHFSLTGSHISEFKSDFAGLYTKTVEELRTRIARGSLVHADETKVRLIGKSGVVWVLSSLEEVVFFNTDTREGDMVQELLKDFRGVLVSDFYAVYDAINCSQQKCLIHLMRDINDDLYRHPYDEELRNIATEYASLIRSMVETIDKHGLKKWFLTKHVPEVEKFFTWLSAENFDSETAQSYQKRFEKNRGKLFTFLAHDGVPWNNNNAENAIRAFAELRQVIGGTCTEKGLREYLVLLSICETCKRRGISFLDFMLSGETNIKESAAGRSSQIKMVHEKKRQWKKPQRGLARRGSIGHKSGSRVPKGISLERRDDCHLAQVAKKREARSRRTHPSPAGEQLEVVRVINDRCKVRTHDGRRAVIVSGIVLAEYSLRDRVGEAYAMVTLVEQGLANQNDVARAFGCSTRTVRRYQRRFEDGGVAALRDNRGSYVRPNSREAI
jgi:predicted RecB family nuclease